MWCIKEIYGVDFIEVAAGLDILQFGKGLPKGLDRQKTHGYLFYSTQGSVNVEYITSRITDAPLLVAVTEAQLRSWEKKKIIAKPCIFTYDEPRFKEMIEKAKREVLNGQQDGNPESLSMVSDGWR